MTRAMASGATALAMRSAENAARLAGVSMREGSTAFTRTPVCFNLRRGRVSLTGGLGNGAGDRPCSPSSAERADVHDGAATDSRSPSAARQDHHAVSVEAEQVAIVSRA